MRDTATDRILNPSLRESGSPSSALSAQRLTIMLVLWACMGGGGLGYLVSHSSAPGTPGAPPRKWPAGSAMQPSGERPTLLMFIHPRCPCTQASLEELARILAHCKGLADVYAVFVRPPRVGNGWERAGNWRTAAAIPEVHMVVDENGAEARRFGATTSGHVQLYDAEGDLQFSGGITGARSHAGDNAGADAVQSWLRRGIVDRRETFVFGCPLLSSHSECKRGDVACHP